ncbi:hypothetical protein COOONC_06281 [Cooperia oncophora]
MKKLKRRLSAAFRSGGSQQNVELCGAGGLTNGGLSHLDTTQWIMSYGAPTAVHLFLLLVNWFWLRCGVYEIVGCGVNRSIAEQNARNLAMGFRNIFTAM